MSVLWQLDLDSTLFYKADLVSYLLELDEVQRGATKLNWDMEDLGYEERISVKPI